MIRSSDPIIHIEYDNYVMFANTRITNNTTIPHIFEPSSLYDTYCSAPYWKQYSSVIASITTEGE